MDIILGALAPKLSKQIKGLDPLFERDADDLSRLYVRGLLTENETRKGRVRLMRKIKKAMTPKRKPNNG